MEIKQRDTVDILGVKIDVINPAESILSIQNWIEKRKSVYICVAPVSTVVSCYYDKDYLKVVNSADMVTPDGMPLVWIAKSRGFKNIARTYGPELMESLCCSGRYRHFFYGGTGECLNRLENKLKQRNPQMNISGRISPPFYEQSEAELRLDIEKINSVKPDILWVGLGSPKQDFWMHKNRDKLDVPVIIGVGAAFDFLSGMKKQAPSWVRRSGLEWLFRLCVEPRRLWRRYLIGNTLFLFLLIKENLKPKRSTDLPI